MAAARIALLGRVDDPAFPPWIERRRLRLGLAGGITERVQGRIEVAVEGAPEMIDAFELACSLGPREVWVEEARRDSGSDAALGKPPGNRP